MSDHWIVYFRFRDGSTYLATVTHPAGRAVPADDAIALTRDGLTVARARDIVETRALPADQLPGFEC